MAGNVSNPRKAKMKKKKGRKKIEIVGAFLSKILPGTMYLGTWYGDKCVPGTW